MFYARGATARSENEMIAYSAPPFPIRAILNRVGLGPKQHRWSRDGGIRRNLRRRLFAVLGKWSSVSALAGRGEILLRADPSGSAASAAIAGSTPRTRGLMSSASAGTHRYAAACTVENKA